MSSRKERARGGVDDGEAGTHPRMTSAAGAAGVASGAGVGVRSDMASIGWKEQSGERSGGRGVEIRVRSGEEPLPSSSTKCRARPLDKVSKDP